MPSIWRPLLRKGKSKPAYVPHVIPKPQPKPPVVVSADIVGRKVNP